MSKQTEALKLALEALKTCDVVDYQQDFDSKKVNKAITALREALAEQPAQQEMTNIERHERNVQKFLAEQPAQQEPVAIHQFRKRGCSDWYDGVPDHHDGHGPYEVRTLYTTPQPQQEPLTDEQLLAVIKKIDRDEQYIQSSLRHLARAIEAAHGITKGNT